MHSNMSAARISVALTYIFNLHAVHHYHARVEEIVSAQYITKTPAIGEVCLQSSATVVLHAINHSKVYDLLKFLDFLELFVRQSKISH